MTLSQRRPAWSRNLAQGYGLASRILTPTIRTTPDAWGAANRTYPLSAPVPGPRDPTLTPYMIPFGRAVGARRHRRVVLACAAQCGKSETLLDIVGQRFDQSPVPTLYVGPSKQFLTEQFEPRIMALLDEAPVLASKVARGKRMTKTRKVISGVPLRLAHAGSSTALKSDPFALALTDEADEMMANVKGQGNPLTLIDRRGDTYADFVHAVVSTCSTGRPETETDPVSGLEFWTARDLTSVESTIWLLFLQGTRHHWCWPCPHCDEYFVPRFSCLQIPEDATPASRPEQGVPSLPRAAAARSARTTSDAMNLRGVYAAPGQRVLPDGHAGGSLVASPWRTPRCRSGCQASRAPSRRSGSAPRNMSRPARRASTTSSRRP